MAVSVSGSRRCGCGCEWGAACGTACDTGAGGGSDTASLDAADESATTLQLLARLADGLEVGVLYRAPQPVGFGTVDTPPAGAAPPRFPHRPTGEFRNAVPTLPRCQAQSHKESIKDGRQRRCGRGRHRGPARLVGCQPDHCCAGAPARRCWRRRRSDGSGSRSPGETVDDSAARSREVRDLGATAERT
jgi:hypothetical protein